MSTTPWDKAYKLSAANEGGVSKDKSDKGNQYEVGGKKLFVGTRYGQTFSNWMSYHKKSKPTTEAEFNTLKSEFEKVTKEDVKASFKAQYWDAPGLGNIKDPNVAANVYDALMNQGWTFGGEGSHATLADTLTNLGYDVDAATSFPTTDDAVAAINKAIDEKGAEAVQNAYSDRRELAYMGSKTTEEHGRGWLTRLNQYRSEDKQYTSAEISSMKFTSDAEANKEVLVKVKDKREFKDKVDQAVEDVVEWAESDNPEQPILDAVDRINKKAEEKKQEKAKAKAEAKAKAKEESVQAEVKGGRGDIGKIVDIRKEEARVRDMSGSFTPPSESRKKEIEDAVIRIGSEMQSQYDDGSLDIDDDSDLGFLNEFLTRLKTDLNMDDIDITNVGAVGEARGVIAYATSFANEELGERIKGGIFDSKIEDVFEDSENAIGRNTKFLGIPAYGESDLSVNKAALQKATRLGGEGGKPMPILSLNEEPTRDNIVKIVKNNPELNARAVREGLTPDELADQLYQESVDFDAEVEEEKQLQKLDGTVFRGESLMNEIEDYEEGLYLEDEEDTDALLKEAKQGIKSERKRKRRDKRRAALGLKPKDQDGNVVGGTNLGAEKALTGLKAAAGILSLSKALRAPDVKTPEISPLLIDALHKQKQLAKSGLTAAEKNAAMSNLNNAYAGAMKNVLRASGGQRGLFLANQGGVDANRIAGLNELAAKDAALHRENIREYNALASSVGQLKLNRDMNVEQMRQATLANNRNVLANIGTNLISDSLSDVGYYVNPNREKVEAVTQQILDQMNGGGNNKGYESPYTDQNIGTASLTSEDKENQENQEYPK
jgi:lysozyme family protein